MGKQINYYMSYTDFLSIAQAETVKKCVGQAMPPTEQRKDKSKTQDMSL